MKDIKAKNEIQQLKELKQWINEQPHYPKNVEETLVIRFLHSNNYDIEKAKQTADSFFNFRGTTPELFTKRDLMSPTLQNMLKVVNFGIYRVGNKNIWFWQLNDSNLEIYDYLEDQKLFLLLSDAWLLDDKYLEEDNISIMDVKDISFKYLTKLKISVARKMFKYQQEGMPVKLTGVHMVNAASILDTIKGILKPFMSKSTYDMIFFHGANSPTLLEHFNRDELPADFGGTKPSMAELSYSTINLLQRNRERLTQDMLWASIKEEPAPKSLFNLF